MSKRHHPEHHFCLRSTSGISGKRGIYVALLELSWILWVSSSSLFPSVLNEVFPQPAVLLEVKGSLYYQYQKTQIFTLQSMAVQNYGSKVATIQFYGGGHHNKRIGHIIGEVENQDNKRCQSYYASGYMFMFTLRTPLYTYTHVWFFFNSSSFLFLAALSVT